MKTGALEESGPAFPSADDIAEREARENARFAATWEVDVVAVDIKLRTPADAAPAIYLVVADGFTLHGDMLPYRPVGFAARVRTFADVVRGAVKKLGTQPARIMVRERGLAEALAKELKGLGMDVLAGDMDDLEATLDELLPKLIGNEALSRIIRPRTWAETEAPGADIAAFHRAAAEFFSARVWTQIEEPVLMQWPEGSVWAVVVTGEPDDTGLVLYSRLSDVVGSYQAPDPGELIMQMEGFGLFVGFGPAAELGRAMRREVAAAGWVVAAPDAYPFVYGAHLPERRLTAADVRRMTEAFRVLTALARGERGPFEGEIVAERLSEHQEHGDAQPGGKPRLWWWAAARCAAEGPGADPEAALWGLDEPERVAALETDRLEHFRTWIAGQDLPGAERDAAAENARIFAEFLSDHGVPASAGTEMDLRFFCYDHYPERADPPAAAARAFAGSLRLIMRFLEEEEGIRYGFASSILDELDALVADLADRGLGLDDDLHKLQSDVWDELEERGLLYDRSIPGEVGWPMAMNLEIAELEREVRRRWLLWFDEAVREGNDDLDEVVEIARTRQREWVRTPHARYGGRTPVQVIRDGIAELASGPEGGGAG